VLPPAAEVATAPQGDAEATSREVTAEVNGRRLIVRLRGLPGVRQPAMTATPHRAPRPPVDKRGARGPSADGAELTSPLQGTVLRVEVKPGARVGQGDLICVVEAMKMENEIAAHRTGTVSSLSVAPGDPVRIGTVLAVIE
jgi:acetyl-CoA/propionyl-CoA carboxylase biotin carboxyl carrier protein